MSACDTSSVAAEHHQKWDRVGHSPTLVLCSSHAVDAESFLLFKYALRIYSMHNVQYIAHIFLTYGFCFTMNQILTLYLNICLLLPFTGTDIHFHQHVHKWNWENPIQIYPIPYTFLEYYNCFLHCSSIPLYTS